MNSARAWPPFSSPPQHFSSEQSLNHIKEIADHEDPGYPFVCLDLFFSNNYFKIMKFFTKTF